MASRIAGVLVALVVLCAAAGTARAADGPLPASYSVPAGSAKAALSDRSWTYDAAVTAAAASASGRDAAARRILDALARAQRADGAFAFSYGLDGRNADSLLRTGANAWVGLAATEYRIETCSTRYDGLLVSLTGWLLQRRVSSPSSPARGLLTGGPDVNWLSTEHNLETRALMGRLEDFALRRGKCPVPVEGMSSALRAQVQAAVAGLDEGIVRELYVRDAGWFRQGVGDNARPLDVQAMGIHWLIGQGRAGEAAVVSATADRLFRVEGRSIDGRSAAGAFSGFRPYAEDWGPDVLWMEGTLQMRLAQAALGQDVSALDASADRWAALTSPGMLLHADREVLGSPAGDFHTWPAAAPAAWLTLSRSGSTLLQ